MKQTHEPLNDIHYFTHKNIIKNDNGLSLETYTKYIIDPNGKYHIISDYFN